MKAPDVIYVEFGEDANLAFERQPFEETPTYLRKDVLLEWIDSELGRLRKVIPDAKEVEDGTASPMKMRYLGQYLQLTIVKDKILRM